MKPPAELIDQIKRQEGCVLTSYYDTLGNLTIGYGHTPAFPAQTITQEEADTLLMDDLITTESELKTALPWCVSLPVPRYCVLWNMAFNMGVGNLLEFKKMLDAINQGNFVVASQQMVYSLWARQVKTRATELAEQMQSGNWFNPEV